MTSVDANKVAAAGYTSGLGDIGSQDSSANFGAQAIGANATIQQSVVFTLTKAETIALIRVNWNGINYGGIDTKWANVPHSITAIDGGGKTGKVVASYVRTPNTITVTLQVTAGSGGFTIGNITASVHSRFYELPF